MKKRSKSIVSLAVISFLVAVSSYPISAQESSETQSEQKIETKSELVQPYTKESTAPSSEKPEPDTASAEKADSTENADSDAETEPGNGGSGGGGEPDNLTEGTIPGLSSAQVQVEPSTGSAGLVIPIEVVPGRLGIQPNLSLVYNSQLPNGMFGVGWTMELGSISRSTKRGVPKYDNTDIFILNQGGATQELFYDASVGYYRPTIENGAFAKIEFLSTQNTPCANTSCWVITDKKGIRYYFGRYHYDYSPEEAGSQEYDSATRIYKWYLDRVTDPKGNYMNINYSKYDGKIYPKDIRYTYQGGYDSHTGVYFVLEDRPATDRPMSYASGFRITTAKRVSEINIKARLDDTAASPLLLQRKYKLNYAESSATGRSLLASVVQCGSDNGATCYPPVIFSYQNEKGFQLASSTNTPWTLQTAIAGPPGNGQDNGTRFIDLNSDGYPDIIQSQRHSGNSYRNAYLNNRVNGWSTLPQNSPWLTPLSCSWWFCEHFSANGQGASYPFPYPYFADVGLRLADINGDGRTDLLQGLYGYWDYGGNQIGNQLKAYLNNSGNGWSGETSAWRAPSGASFSFLLAQAATWINVDLGSLLVDVDNNGYVDIIKSNNHGQLCHDQNCYNVNGRWAFMNNANPSGSGQGWTQNSTWTPPSSYADFSLGATLVDLNGDGLPDIFYKRGGGANVQMNTGQGWVDQGTNSPWYDTTGRGNLDNGSTQFADINGDGLEDMMIADGSSNATLINTGSGWRFDSAWALPTGDFRNFATRLIDVNGDGLIDFITNGTSSSPTVYLNRGKHADLLSRVENGFGGSSTIEYDSSARYSNTFLPFPLPVVKSTMVSTYDHLLQSQFSLTTRYSYRNGLWNAADRDFRGFEYTKVIDSDNNYIETQSLQDGIYKGKVLRQTSYDASNNLLGKTENTWACEALTANGCVQNSQQTTPNGSGFVYLRRVDNYVYDGNATGKRTAQEFYYDEPTLYQTPQYGNLTKTVQLGEVDLTSGTDIGNDKRTVETTYNNSTSGLNCLQEPGSTIWMIGFPKKIVIKDNAAADVRKSFFYYDRHPNYNDPVTCGKLTKKEQWNGDINPAITERYDYDGLGNIYKVIDAKGNETIISYDGPFYILPVRVTNALSQRTETQYYGVNGVAFDDGNGLRGLWGQIKSVTDPNNQSSYSTYDVLGRLRATVSPLDSINYPTSIVNYEFFSNYIKVTNQARVNHGQPATLDTVEFYDGLGRLIQGKARGERTGEYVVSGHTEYNGRGLPWKQYLPFFVTTSIDTLDQLNTSQPFSTLEYDSNGRVIKSTSPDGNFSTVAYDDWVTTGIDENGHMQKTFVDAYGQVVERREYMGANGRGAPTYPATTGPIDNYYTLYATTQYGYDSEGSLVQTRDAHNNVTTIEYDKVGRKTRMTDPDMGLWEYGYDLNSNLLWQRDAKNQQIDFTYDALNRLLTKNGPNLNVAYTYDDPLLPFSIGRLVRVQYSLVDETQFFYDALGREIKSRKIINRSVYEVERTYDALNRLVSVKYPDGNTIFYTYNAAGQVEKVAEAVLPEPPRISPPFLHYKLNDNTNTTDVLDHGLRASDGVIPNRTALMINANGNNGSTNFIDTARGHTFAAQVGGVQISTAESKFGGSSIAFDGVDDYLALVDHSDWDLSTMWTMDFWVKHNNTSGTQYYVEHAFGLNNRWALFHQAGAGIKFVFYNQSSTPTVETTAAGEITDTNWHHIVFAHTFGGRWSIYKDGSLIAYVRSNFISNINGWLALGTSQGSSNYLNGYIDDFRIAQANVFDVDPDTASAQIQVPAVEQRGTIASSDLSTPGKVSNAFQFSRSGLRSVKIDNQVVADITTHQEASISLWVKHGNLGGDIFFLGDTNADRFFSVSQLRTNDMEFIATDYWWLEAPNILPDDNWTHIVLVMDGVNQPKVYRNGVLFLPLIERLGSPQYNNVYSPLLDNGWMGCNDYNNAGSLCGFSGKLDDFRYYNKVLTPQEVYSLYNDGFGTEEREPVIIPSGNPRPAPVDVMAYVSNVDYNPSGQIIQIDYGNGVRTNYAYDQRNLRLQNITSVSRGINQTIQNFDYNYDSLGDILNITDRVHTATQSFHYDELNRLLDATGNYCPTNPCIKTFAYNAIGNITSKDNLTYAYGQNGAGPHAVTSLSDGTIFRYDVNGNMINKTKAGVLTEYLYDTENRLTTAKRNGVPLADFAYDGDGGRTKKIVNTSVTHFVGSLYEQEGSRRVDYIFLGGTRIASLSGGKVLYYHSDHLGGTNVLTDQSGVKKELIEYQPFGEYARHDQYGNSEEVARFYFTGKKLDDETGLYFFGARYYDPVLGRFITADSVVQNPYDPQTLNRYSYTSNNPVNRIDPDGHKWSWGKFWKAAVGAFVGIMATIILGPGGIGFFTTAWGAGIFGGALGGAITGGLEGGWKGALIGAAMGGALGGLGGWVGGIARAHQMTGQFIAGTLIAGAGVAAATNSWDSFAGGLTGGLAGWAIGNGIVKSEQFKNFKAGKGVRSNATVRAEERKLEFAKASLDPNRAGSVKLARYRIPMIEPYSESATDYVKAIGKLPGHALRTMSEFAHHNFLDQLGGVRFRLSLGINDGDFQMFYVYGNRYTGNITDWVNISDWHGDIYNQNSSLFKTVIMVCGNDPYCLNSGPWITNRR